MDLNQLPAAAFIHPSGDNRPEIEALLQQVTHQLLDHLTAAAQQTPLPAPEGSLPPLIPEEPTAIAEVLSTLEQIIRQSMNPAHPGYMGHMDPMPTTLSILGDWVAAALNNNMLSVEMSPPFSRLEPRLMRAIAGLFGLGDQAGGLLLSGGSLANLQALAVARNCQLGTGGLAHLPQPPVIFASEMAHTSIQKAAMVLGLGAAGVIPIATNGHAQMQPAALKDAINQANAAGQRPIAVVATAGTTVTGNIDPLPDIARIAQANDLWLHVDAAYGGALMFSPTHRDRLRGIEQADSITFNPQKWLYVTKTCASVLFRDRRQLHDHFQVAAPYMNTEDEWVNLGEISVQGTRHVDVLKLWLSLQHLGKQGCAALIDASYALTNYFVRAVRQRPHLHLASEPEMNLVCFRGCPTWLPEDAWDQWNQALQTYLLQKGHVFLSLPTYRQQKWLKAVLLNPFTEPKQIDRLFQHLDTFTQARG